MPQAYVLGTHQGEERRGFCILPRVRQHRAHAVSIALPCDCPWVARCGSVRLGKVVEQSTCIAA